MIIPVGVGDVLLTSSGWKPGTLPEHSVTHRTANSPPQRGIQPKTSVVLRLRNPDLED